MIRAERIVSAAADVRGAIERLLDELGRPWNQPLSLAIDELNNIVEGHTVFAARVERALDDFRGGRPRLPEARQPHAGRMTICVFCECGRVTDLNIDHATMAVSFAPKAAQSATCDK